MVDSAGGTDSKAWQTFVNGTDLYAQTVNDANSNVATWLDVTRSANTISAITLGNSTNKPTITLNGPVAIPGPGSGNALSLNGVANSYAVQISAPNTTGQSLGVNINAGTNASDTGFRVQNAAGTANYLGVRGDGSLFAGPNGSSTFGIAVTGAVSIGAPSSGNNALAVTGVANSNAGAFFGSSTTGQSFGLATQAGTNSSDYSFAAFSQGGGTLFKIFGDGGTIVGSPTGGDKGLGSVNMQSCFVNNVACSTSTGTVTSITAGTGLTGGTITGSGTIALSTPVSVANGGTGTATPGLVAGTNVTISGVWPNQTVSTKTPFSIAAPASGNALSATGATGSLAELLTGSAVAGDSFGLGINAGTNPSDYGLLVTNQTGSTNYLEVFGDGGVIVGNPSGGDKGTGNFNASGIYQNNTPVCLSNGTNCPATAISLVAYGTFSATCSASISKNMSCSSHSTGSGIYNLSVAAAGFPSTPVCTTSTGVAFAQFAFGSSSSTIVQIATYNSSGANADEAFSVICVQ